MVGSRGRVARGRLETERQRRRSRTAGRRSVVVRCTGPESMLSVSSIHLVSVANFSTVDGSAIESDTLSR